jgi:hypothetical protein
MDFSSDNVRFFVLTETGNDKCTRCRSSVNGKLCEETASVRFMGPDRVHRYCQGRLATDFVIHVAKFRRATTDHRRDRKSAPKPNCWGMVMSSAFVETVKPVQANVRG